MFIHHANKHGNQRGTSAKEDVMDTVVQLSQPAGYTPEDGANFQIHFDKSRGFYGADAAPMEVRMVTDDQGCEKWERSTSLDSTYEKIVELAMQGIKQVEIAEKLGVNKSTVSKYMKTARAEGRLSQER